MTLPADVLRDGKAWLPRVLVAPGSPRPTGRRAARSTEGGVRLDGEPLGDPDAEFDPGDLVGKVLQVGRRRFARIAGVVD